ncbi:MAG: selenocysteine-specific translation elongation factor [Chloroflexota bacterium]
MTVVVGTAGHIDHGKTALLRALTGIDADRLPEEQRRGMTIDVGYAHLALPDGTTVDFVDVPGHDRLVGNMLVGAGEIDAALLVVAADDGPRAQTLEHLSLLDGFGIADGLVAITKADLVGPDRLDEVRGLVRMLLAPTGLAEAPVLAVSSVTGAGIAELRVALGVLAGRVAAGGRSGGGARLAVDRAFTVRGRGVVVTGSLRGGPLGTGEGLRLLPGGRSVRARELQVHGGSVARALGGRTAVNLAGVELGDVARGDELTLDPAVAATDRLLVALARPRAREAGRRAATWPPGDGTAVRLHLGTAEAGARIGRAGRDALGLPDARVIAMLRLERAVAAAPGDRFVLRRVGAGGLVAGGLVLDVVPARGVSRRRQTEDRVAALAAAAAGGDREAIAEARLDLHGLRSDAGGGIRVAPDVLTAASGAARSAVEGWHASRAADPGMPLPALRDAVGRAIRRLVTAPGPVAVAAADAAIAAAVADGTLVREGDRLRLPGHRAAGPDPALLAAMDRLEAALSGPTPPSLAAAAALAACPPDGIRALERAGRIVVAADDLAWAAATYRELAARAVVMATRAPLTPAAYRDATGTSRRYALAILEDLDRRGILRRTDAGHVPGPKAPPLPARPSG